MDLKKLGVYRCIPREIVFKRIAFSNRHTGWYKRKVGFQLGKMGRKTKTLKSPWTLTGLWHVGRAESRMGGLPAFYGEGNLMWFKHRELHRGDDLPAVIDKHGVKTYRQHGKRIRINGRPIRVKPGGIPYGKTA